MIKTDKTAMIRTGMISTGMALGLAATALSLGGCSAVSAESQPSAYTAMMLRPVNTEVYPAIEGQLPVAAAQMSNEEAAEQEARLTALGSARASGALSDAEYRRRLAELRSLAANHGTDTLKQIQN